VAKKEVSTAITARPIDPYLSAGQNIDLLNGKGLKDVKWEQVGTSKVQSVARIPIDGSAIDGQELKIYKLWDVQAKKEYYSFEFKFTEDSGATVWKSLTAKKASAESGYLRTNLVSNGKLTEDKWVGREAKIKKAIVRGPDGKIASKFYMYSPKDKYASYMNRVFIDVIDSDLKSAVAKFGDMAKNVGIDGLLTSTSEADRLSYLKARVAWADKAADIGNLEKYTFENISGYQIPMKELPKEVLDQVETLYHCGSIEDMPNLIKSGQFISTEVRTMAGIGDKTTGLSCTADLRAGGANGVFTRISPVGEDLTKITVDDVGTGRVRYIIDKSQLNRLDWYGYDSDSYGKTGLIEKRWLGRQKFINTLADKDLATVVGNEQIFRNFIDFKYVKEIQVDAEAYDKVISVLNKAKITNINGIPIKKFIRKIISV
jgi:hypothetical protein